MNWNRRPDEDTDVHVLGDPTDAAYGSARTRRRNLGGAGQRWAPADYDYYERQWRTQRGAWGDPDEAQTQLEDDVDEVTAAFAERGHAAGMQIARRKGLADAAKHYVKHRGRSEELLAVELARIRARLAKRPRLRDKLREAFVAARLRVVRLANKEGKTPDPAVVDKPDLPRKYVSRWIPYIAITLSVLSFLRAGRTARRGR